MEPVTEIRHKTAVSTIRSTAEKSSRDRSRSRAEDVKKRVAPLKKETPRGTLNYLCVTVKIVFLGTRGDTKKTSSSREISNHRISTAYVPVCNPRSRNVHDQPDECPCLCS